MVEAGAQQVSEEEVLGAIEFGHDCCKKIAAGIRKLVAIDGQAEARIHAARAQSRTSTPQFEKLARDDLTDALNTKKYEKLESYARVAALKKKVIEATAGRAADWRPPSASTRSRNASSATRC